MKHYYCTALSGAYCYQGLILFNSLTQRDKNFSAYYVCLDSMAYEILSALNKTNLVLITVEQLEDYFPELKFAKQDRAINEYAWTLKASEMLYIFEHYKEVDHIIWLDSDTQILSDPKSIFDEWGDRSILLTEQYYTDHHESLVKTYGRFQAGCIGFRRNDEGLKCLRWWQKQCIEWCYFHYEEGRWADQKYLDMIPTLCKKVCIIKNLGINMTPFILYRLNFEQQKFMEVCNDGLFINGINLVLYHYYGFKYYDERNIDLCRYWMKFSESTIQFLYIPYIEACTTAIHEIEAVKSGYSQLLEKKNTRIFNYLEPLRMNADVDCDIATIVCRETLQEAIALYSSILQHGNRFYWWVCCCDMDSYNEMQLINLPNATIVYIENLLDSYLITEMKKKAEMKKMEKLKTYFMFYLLKNNYPINKLIYIHSDFYFYESLYMIIQQLADRNAVLFKDNGKKSNLHSSDYEKDLLGLKNNKETVDFLEYCTDLNNDLFKLNENVLRYMNPNFLSRVEYCSTFNDLKYNKIVLKDGRLYINNNLIKAFHFSDNEKLKDGKVNINKKAKKYLKNDLYNCLYENYNMAINSIREQISGKR